MTEIRQLPPLMTKAAITLQTGQIIFAYKDGTAVRMETENGRDAYVWRRNRWKRMRSHSQIWHGFDKVKG